MTILIGGVPANQRGLWEGRNSMCSTKLNGVHFVFIYDPFPVFMFWITGTRLVPPNVKETYSILRKCRTHMLLCNWQLSRLYVPMQLFCRTGQTRGNEAVR